MELTLHRGRPALTLDRSLPAAVYNLSRALLARSPLGCVFVPIRSLQYLAVLDREEFVFVDSRYRSEIAISWREFRPRARSGLDEPVPFRCVLYHRDEAAVAQRLGAEFDRALRALAAKQPPPGPATVIALTPPSPD